MSNRILQSLFVIIFLVSSFAAAAGLPPTASLVPAETVAYFEISNFGEFKSQIEKTDIYKLYKEPSMAALIADTKTKLREEMFGDDEGGLFKSIIDADIVPQGRAAFCLVLDSKALMAEEPMPLFFVEWGSNLSKIQELITASIKKEQENDLKVEKQDYRGVEITTVSSKDEQIADGDLSDKINFCYVGDCLMGSANIDTLRFAIAHAKGATSETLGSGSNFNSVMKAVGPYHDIDVYVNISKMLQSVMAEDESGEARKMITNLGFENLGSFSVSMGIAREPGSSYSGKGLLKINGEKRGIFKMLDPESGPIVTPRFVSSTAYSTSFYNVNFKKAFSELSNVIMKFSPMGAMILQSPLTPPGADGSPPVQLQSGIIDNLGSGIVFSQMLKKPFSLKSSPTESLIALSVTNRGALEQSISSLHGTFIASGRPELSRELLGYRLFLIDAGGMLPFLGGGMRPMADGEDIYSDEAPGEIEKLAVTVTDTHVIIGIESAVEGAIRTLVNGSSGSVGTTSWYNKTKSAVPSSVGMAGLEDTGASMELLWWLLKNSANGQRGNMGMMPFGDISEILNVGLMPEFELIRKYFGYTVSYGMSRSDGFFVEFKDIKSR